MTDHNPSAGNAPARLSLADCQTEATMVHGVAQGLYALMEDSTKESANASYALVMLLTRELGSLADKLDAPETEARRHA